MDEARRFLLEFLGPGTREAGVYEGGRFRRFLLGPEGFADYVLMPDVYYSVRTLEDYVSDAWDRLFLDVDAHDGGVGEARDVLLHVVSLLVVRGVDPVCIFSGRGYHIYVLFAEPVRLDVDSLRREVASWHPRLDTQVLNSFPMARLPYTYNTKSGRLAVPVSCFAPEEVDARVVRVGRQAVGELFGEGAELWRPGPVERDPVDFGAGEYPLCVLRMIAQLAATGELSHFARFALATFLLRAAGRDAAVRVFGMGSDYRPHVTEYQLGHIASRGYMFPSCGRVEAEGFCTPHVRCPFRPWLERYLRGWEDVGREVGGSEG